MDSEELKKLAELARIDVAPAELYGLEKSLGDILGYISDIQNVSASTESDAHTDQFSLRNVMREEIESPQSDKEKEELLYAAPQKEDGYVRVKKFFMG